MKSSGFRSRRPEETELPGRGAGWGGVHGPATPSLLAVKWPRRAGTPVHCLAQGTPGWPPTLQSHCLCWRVCQGCVRPALWPGR